jgi:hypothetical protein
VSGRAAPAGFALLAGLAAFGFLLGPLRGRGGAPSAVAESDGPELERDAIRRSLEALDEDLDTGKLTAEDHAAMRTALRARAAALLIETQVARSEPQASGVDPAARRTALLLRVRRGRARARRVLLAVREQAASFARAQASEDQYGRRDRRAWRLEALRRRRRARRPRHRPRRGREPRGGRSERRGQVDAPAPARGARAPERGIDRDRRPPADPPQHARGSATSATRHCSRRA